MKYFLVIENGTEKSERDATQEVNLHKGVQGYYHIAKLIVEAFVPHLKTSLYKETEHGREFIYNIP